MYMGIRGDSSHRLIHIHIYSVCNKSPPAFSIEPLESREKWIKFPQIRVERCENSAVCFIIYETFKTQVA